MDVDNCVQRFYIYSENDHETKDNCIIICMTAVGEDSGLPRLQGL